MAKTFESILAEAAAILDKGLSDELRAQGHHLTGALEKSIVGKVVVITGGLELIGSALSYSQILNYGVTPERIPFSGTNRGSGGGGKSAYIEGLKTYFLERGLSLKEAQSAAFATAMKHKQEGMPTNESSIYSSTGHRTEFIRFAEQKSEQVFNDTVNLGIDQLIDEVYHETKSETI